MTDAAQKLYDKHITTISVGNFLGFIPLDRHYERVAVEQFNDQQTDFCAMKLIKSTASSLTFNGMKPEHYEEFRKVAGY